MPPPQRIKHVGCLMVYQGHRRQMVRGFASHPAE